MVRHITLALDEMGDAVTDQALVAQLQASGTGLVHQRNAFARPGSFDDVVTDAAKRTDPLRLQDRAPPPGCGDGGSAR